MRGIRALCAVAIVLAPLAAILIAQDDELAAVPRITQAEFKRLLEQGKVVVVDTRDAFAFAGGHIPGAISMPLEQVARRVPLLEKEKRLIVTYCA